MERKICFLIFLAITSSIFVTASDKDQIYKAYVSGNMGLWKETIDRMEQKKSTSDSFLLELVNYQYGYIGWAMGTDRLGEARNYLELAEKHIERLNKKGYSPSSLLAYRSAFYGFRVGMNRFQAPVLGPKSVSMAKKAIETDPDNPLGYIQLGNSEYYMPAVFGGSKSKALEYFLKAKSLMEEKPMGLKNDWNYLNLLTLIAQVYIDLSENVKAKKLYEEILRIEPDFIWVRNELYQKVK